ncbi:hypothetical protein FHR81_002880 [Actinoalloteichus hoggarensis]|uniref:Uncharacterized protein n=1 Tax=Actinoalloteichus hoggarensis TaxID=1470176 RepID=A0A221VY43_9PSEU|nr:hypothetical protein [Actinoalloteichus hoggarensis]ASO18472.1 hypothetical protein AHOG_04080 [Actinoalloteichus hoggarensis]MBB5921840.1 hypothetical protein [Actinoalloteichus hoggarensis]
MSPPRPPSLPSEDELRNRIGDLLLAAAPPDWQRIDLKALMASTVRDVSLTVVTADGGSPPVAPTPELSEDLARLRQATADPEQGAWFSLRFTVDPPRTFQVSYNYLHEPQWVPPVEPAVFVADLLAFPRAARHVPRWLADRLAQATRGDAPDPAA